MYQNIKISFLSLDLSGFNKFEFFLNINMKSLCKVISLLFIGKSYPYRNQFVTQYITYLIIWGVISKTLPSLSTHGVGLEFL